MNNVQKNRLRTHLTCMPFFIVRMAGLVAIVVASALSGCSSTATQGSFDAYSWEELAKIAAEIHDAPTDEDGMDIAMSYHLLDSPGKVGLSKLKRCFFGQLQSWLSMKKAPPLREKRQMHTRRLYVKHSKGKHRGYLGRYS